MSFPSFFTEDFLLRNDFAKRLYHGFAKDQPIIDYHCHLPPDEIASDKMFENITDAWLKGDHYKWRAMRTLGIPEKFITGSATSVEKFNKWASAVPHTMRNPLFHWTYLELKRYFDIDEVLSPDNADKIYNTCNEKLKTSAFTIQSLIRKMKVEVIGTTDDPIDSLEHHKKINNSDFKTRVVPSFRPDKSFAVEDAATYKAYIEKLSAASGVTISSFDDLLQALKNRVDYFHEAGGRLSDHGLENIPYPLNGKTDPQVAFKKLQNNQQLSADEIVNFKYHVLVEACKMYHQKGWTQQFHLGALRNNNTRLLSSLGPDTGFDSIGDFAQAVPMSKFLNELDSKDQLAKTILYNLNPADNEVLATMTGNFNDGTIKGKIQFGSGWWFNDQKDGMEKHLNALSNLRVLSCFIGMLTDSRSFLSYPRHEYFRRILCNLIGTDVVNGELPADEKWLGKMVADICYANAKEYFNFDS